MISMEELLMGRDVQYPLNEELKRNLLHLYTAINEVRKAYGKPMHVTSGYRPAAINATTAGASKTSWHQVCLAVDIADVDGALNTWCKANPAILRDTGLYCEERVGPWQHFQLRAPRSNKLWFYP